MPTCEITTGIIRAVKDEYPVEGTDEAIASAAGVPRSTVASAKSGGRRLSPSELYRILLSNPRAIERARPFVMAILPRDEDVSAEVVQGPTQRLARFMRVAGEMQLLQLAALADGVEDDDELRELHAAMLKTQDVLQDGIDRVSAALRDQVTPRVARAS